MAESWSGSPSPGKTLHKNYLQKTKKSSFPSRGTRTGNTKSCGTTLFAAYCGHFRNGANTPSALNAGNTSADTLDCSISPCPRRPICCSAFRSDLSFRNSLWMRYAALLPRLWFGVSSVAFIKHYICPFVKHFFLPGADSLANFPPACYDKENLQITVCDAACAAQMQNAECKMQNDCAGAAHEFNSFSKKIPQFCILHFEFCISGICPINTNLTKKG